MLEDKKELIVNFAGLAITTGLAIATQGSSYLALGVMGGIAGNLASSFIEKTDYKRIKNLLNQTDPSELNHDLKKVVVKSVEWAVENIQILYQKNLEDNDEIKQLKIFTKQLIREIKVLEDSLLENESRLYTKIENPKDIDSTLRLFELKLNDLPTINSELPYNDFFKKEFTPNLQLCFGELLKKDKNRPAFIAYQREVYQNLDSGLNKIIEQNNDIISRLNNSHNYIEQNKVLKKIKKKINSTAAKEISPVFEAIFNKQIMDLSSKTELLILKSEEISNELEKVKNITKGISTDLKTGWVEKNKFLVIALFSSALLIIVFLAYHLNSQPFSINIGLEIDKSIRVDPKYPELSNEARIRFFFPAETKEKEVTFLNEILLSDIPSEMEGKFIKIELIDKYWNLKSDSLKLKNGNISLLIMPNNRLSKVYGQVFTIKDGIQNPIKGAVILVDQVLETSTGKDGKFFIEIPYHRRKLDYAIEVKKEGYHPFREQCQPNTTKPIRLIKSKQ